MDSGSEVRLGGKEPLGTHASLWALFFLPTLFPSCPLQRACLHTHAAWVGSRLAGAAPELLGAASASMRQCSALQGSQKSCVQASDPGICLQWVLGHIAPLSTPLPPQAPIPWLGAAPAAQGGLHPTDTEQCAVAS